MKTEEFQALCENMIARLDGEHTLLGDMRRACCGNLLYLTDHCRSALVDAMDILELMKQEARKHPEYLNQ